jgi:hypothetical protein
MSPIPRPRRGIRWLASQTSTYDVLITVFASLIGFSAAANYAAQQRVGLAWMVGLATVCVLFLTTAKHVVGLVQARKRESMHELEGCLHTLHAILAPPERGRLRLAIHVPVKDSLEQVTEYIGDTPKPGRVGRRFPANAGIIGRAFREHEVFVGRRVNDDYEAYVRELVRDWNYTEERARRLNPAVMEWMAVPFYDTDRNHTDAVLYLDATQREFFTSERQELVLAAVRGIAIFIGKRYS